MLVHQLKKFVLKTKIMVQDQVFQFLNHESFTKLSKRKQRNQRKKPLNMISVSNLTQLKNLGLRLLKFVL
jgi:hypothetical protein